MFLQYVYEKNNIKLKYLLKCKSSFLLFKYNEQVQKYMYLGYCYRLSKKWLDFF
jgi:hypothetical protein